MDMIPCNDNFLYLQSWNLKIFMFIIFKIRNVDYSSYKFNFLLMKHAQNVFIFIVNFNIFHKKVHMSWTIQNSFYKTLYRILIFEKSLVNKLISNLWSWFKKTNCILDCHVKLDAKISKVYYIIDHILFIFWYLKQCMKNVKEWCNRPTHECHV